jgi:aspartyl-tRNA(Asn)/glutamyl-tRNA(Gln) amidotransferase subunit A
MIANPDDLSASEIAHSVAAGKMSALSVTEAALARIARHDPVLNSFTDVTAERARAKARAVDAMIAAGQDAGPLAGVPFAVKNLFDVQGLPTRAGSKINRDLKPSARDATLIERMEAAGAVLVGALNMGEYAYDFTGENVHDGPSRNPHDVTRMTGGSSGGSGGAVGGGLVPQRLDPGAIVVLRNLWTEADLWTAVACEVVSVRRELRSSWAVRAQRPRSRAGL